MTPLYGFIQLGNFVDNTKDTVALFGEISEDARSYAIETSKYRNDSQDGVELISFRNRGLVSNPVADPHTQIDANHVIAIAYWVSQESLKGFITSDRTVFLSNLTGAYGSQITNIACGSILNAGGVYMPEWVSWSRIEQVDGKPTAGLPVKIWFSDDSFRRQYSGYDIMVVPPVDTMDSLFGGRAEVKQLLTARALSQTLALVESNATTAAPNTPYNVVTAQEYDWVDRVDNTFTVPSAWTVAVWGAAGNNPDVIREVLVAYILARTEHSRADWEAILPDLFISTEFLVVPNWDQYAIPNKTMDAGLYSPALKVGEGLSLAKKGMPTYADAHLNSYLRYATHPYRSLGFLVCGGNRNRDKIYDFYEKFKDYIALASTHVDFNRIDPVTQQWMLLFAEAIQHAETITEYSDVPQGFSRLKRNGLIYVAFSYNKVQYLVLTKYGREAGSGVEDVVGEGTWLREAGKWIETYSAATIHNKLDAI